MYFLKIDNAPSYYTITQVSRLSAEKEKYKNKLRTVLEQLHNDQKRSPEIVPGLESISCFPFFHQYIYSFIIFPVGTKT